MIKTIYTIIEQTVNDNGVDVIAQFGSFTNIEKANDALKKLHDRLYEIYDTKLIEYQYLFCYTGSYDSKNCYHYSTRKYYKIIKSEVLLYLLNNVNKLKIYLILFA